MIDFRKRALILTLAATVSVTGSFAADNYKNCLMNMEFNSSGGNQINLVLNTKKPYESKISPIRKDLSTYVIMLPEMDNQAPTPNISSANNFIESVDIRKMPYSNGAKGYTRIVIKTNGNINLNASTALYVPKSDIVPQLFTIEEENDDDSGEISENDSENNKNGQGSNVRNSNYSHQYNNSSLNQTYEPQDTDSAEVDKNNSTSEYNNDDNATAISEEQNPEPQNIDLSSNENNQKSLLGLLVIFIIMTSIYAFIKTQDKLTNVMGEKLNIDIDEEPPKPKKDENTAHKISKTINKLDNLYSKTTPSMLESFNAKSKPISKNREEENKSNIVDLDALFKEKQSNSDDNNMRSELETNDLDDFLSEFSFDLDEPPAETANNQIENDDNSLKFNEELYQQLINNKKIKFSTEDIDCFNVLLQSEISDSVINNIEQYATSNPIKAKPLPPEKVLENLVTEYTISQGISFSTEDVNILRKLISVEIDSDFINDLRTNSQKTIEMEKEINSESKPIKPSKAVTLKVRDMLPNLSEALKKQGNKPIVSEAKPETIYYHDGYEVNKLSINFDLPDLSKELNNKQAYVSKPTADYPTVDNSYKDSVEKLTVSGLPDLKDAVKNPEKYQEKEKEEYIPDENDLLNKLSNVTFKPFDDGSRNFEIINDFNDETENNTADEVINIRKEFSQFNNFEVSNSEEKYENYTNSDFDDFEAIYNQDYVDLDSLNQNNKPKPAKIKEEKSKEINNTQYTLQNLKPIEPKVFKREQTSKSEELINKINADKKSAKPKKNIEQEPIKTTTVKNEEKIANSSMKCIIDNVSYEILNTAKIENELGFHLAKSSDGYTVLAFVKDKLSVIKTYETVKSEKIQVRLSETLKDGTQRYLIKISTSKFLADFKDNKIEYVMDLC